MQVLWCGCVTPLQSASLYWCQTFSFLVTSYVRLRSWCSEALAGRSSERKEWDLTVWVCGWLWVLGKTCDLPLLTVKSASKLVQCHFLLFEAKLMPLPCDSPVTLLCM